MDGVTLKQLRYFEAVARHGHFGRAAEACAISQPAISVQIRELEQTLGAALFERGARKVRLTAFGAQFAGRVRETLRHVDDLGNLARAAQSGLGGTLRLGVIPTVAPYFLPGVIRDLTAAYPTLDLHLRETQTETLLRDLAEARLDLALLALPTSEDWLTEEPLFEESFILVRHQSDAGDPVPDAASLQKMRLLLLEEGHCFRDQALAFCEARSLRPHQGMEGTSLSTLVQMVGAGLGVTLIPEMAVAVERRSARVSLARFPDPQPSRKLGLVWRKSNPLDAPYRQMAEVMRDTARAFFDANGIEGGLA